MADVLGVTASIAGIISLADTVYHYVFRYTRGVLSARDDAKHLAQEINSLSTVLRSLYALATVLESENQLHDPALNVQHLVECQQTIEKIRKSVKKAANDFDNSARWPGLSRQLKWPFSASEIRELLSKIARYKDIISLAASADTMRQLQASLSLQIKHQQETMKLLDHAYKKIEITTAISLDTKRQRILDFFMDPDLNPQSSLKQNISLHQPTTGNWLLESEAVKGWFDTPGSHLWLEGIAGGGKTILASVVIQEALSRNLLDCGRAFFFCDYKKENTLLPINILGTIATQLALQKDECFICLENYHTELHPERSLSSKPDVDELRTRITQMASYFSRVLIVIDGIDECHEEARQILLTSLVELADRCANIGMALFSRDEMDIRVRLETDFEAINIEAHTDDIATYVQAEMERRRISGRLVITNKPIKDEIEHELIARAHGMFRWVSCQLDYLCEFATDEARKKALADLPPTLPSSYQRILQKISERPLQIRKMVQLCLQFIAFFPQRLTINELCQVVSVPETLGVPLDSTNTVLERSIAWICSSLIRKSADGVYFELAHFTVLEFLRSSKVSERPDLAFFMPVPSESRFLMGLQCLRFLQLANFNKPVSSVLELLLRAKEIIEHSTFYTHAARYWTTLISDHLHKHSAYEAATRFFQRPCSPCFRLWILTIATAVRAVAPKQTEQGSMDREKEDWFPANLAFESSLDPLHFACALNFDELCPALLGRGCDLNCLCNGLTSLSASEVSLFGLFEPNVELLTPDSTIFLLVLPSSIRRNATAKYLVQAGATRSASTEIDFAGMMLFAWHLQDFSTIIDFLSKGGVPTDTDLKSLTIYFHKWRHTFVISTQLEPALLKLNKFLYDTSLLETTWGFDLGSLLWSTAVFLGMSFTSDPAKTDTRISLSLDGLRTQMKVAVKNDDAEALRNFLKDGRVGIEDCWTSDSTSPTTLLQDAAWHSAGRCFDILLGLGSDLYALNEDGDNAISRMDTEGDGSLLDTMVRRGVDILKPNTDGANLWHMVALKPSNPQFFDALIHTNPDGSRKAMLSMTAFGMTPLCIALRTSDANNDYEYGQPFEDREAKALRFIEYCNSVPQFWVKHDSILNMAFDFSSIKIMEKLIDLGVYPTNLTTNDPSPLHRLSLKASQSWVCFLKTMFPGAIGQRYKDRLPLEIYFSNVIEKKVSLDQLIVTELSSHEILSSKDQHNDMPWQYVCRLPERYMNRNQPIDHGHFNSVWESLISLRAMEFFEQHTGQCGMDIWIPSLYRLAEDKCCPLSDIISGHMLDVAIESSLYWNPSSEHVIRFLRQALHFACQDVIETLLNRGVDVHQPLEDMTTIAYACMFWPVLLSKFGEIGKSIYLTLFEHSQESKLNDFCLHGNLLHWTSRKATNSDAHDGLRWLVTQLVRKGVDIEGVDEDAPVNLRIPPLLHHVSMGSFAVAEMLLDMGANVNLTVGHNARAVVHECVRHGNVQFLKKLVGLHQQKKQDIDWERPSIYDMRLPGSVGQIEMTPLHMACSEGNHECVRLLLSEANASLEKKASRGLAVLHFAAMSGNTAIINELVGMGHSVTVYSDTGDTPLHLAADNGHLFAVKSLIELGALDTTNNSYSTAQTLAARKGYNEIVTMLEEEFGSAFYDNVAGNIAARKTRTLLKRLRSSIYSGNIKGCQRSQREGCPLDRGLPLEDGCTPLLLALNENQLYIATWLLDRGVSVFRRLYSMYQPGFTSAIISASGRTDLVRLLPTLLDHYVNQTPDWVADYWYAIWGAISNVNSPGLEVLLSFLKVQLDKLMCPSDRDTFITGVINKIDGALHYAVRGNDLETVKLLLQHGVDIDRLDSSGRSVLLEVKTKDMVALLLSFGISLGPLVSESAYDLVALWHNASSSIMDLLVSAILKEGLHHTLRALEWSSDAILPIQIAISGPIIGITHLGYASGKDLPQQNYVSLLFDRQGTQYLHSSGFFLEDPQPFPWHLIEAAEVENLSFLRENIAAVNKLFGSESSKRWLNMNPTKGWGPLCRAASMNHIRAMENCLSLGADIDFEGSPLGSALMIACACGQLSAVKLLMRKGANPVYYGKHGWISVMELARSKVVRKWLLVGRFNDQLRLHGGSDVPTPGMQAQTTGRWRGPIQVRVNLNGFEEIREGESTLNYAKRLAAHRRSMYGWVPDYIESFV